MKLVYHTMSFGKKENRILLTHLKKPVRYGFAGMVSSRLFPQNVALIVSQQSNTEREYDLACLAIAPGSSSVRIEMDDSIFYGVKRGENLARTVLFHELGHYYHNHLKGGTMDISKYDTERFAKAASGEPIQQEVEADAFAAQYLGLNYVEEGLRSLIGVLRNHIDEGIFDDETGEMAVRELELRIEALVRTTG